MNTGNVIKGAIIGGIVAVVFEFIVGAVAIGAAYDFSFVAMLIAGFLAAWIAKGKAGDGIVSGVVGALIYVILGLFIIYPLFGHSTRSPVAAIIVGVVLGLIGGFIGNYLACPQRGASSSAKPSGRKRR
jgi:hypothetical protein